MRDLWGNSKHTNIHIIGVPDGEEREKGVENVSDEITAENFPNLKKEIDIQIEATELKDTITELKNTLVVNSKTR